MNQKHKPKKLHFTGKRYIYARSGEGIKTKGLLLTDSEFKKAHERWKKSKRPSPSTSATSVNVGTEMYDGDGRQWICKSYLRDDKQIKHWVRK